MTKKLSFIKKKFHSGLAQSVEQAAVPSPPLGGRGMNNLMAIEKRKYSDRKQYLIRAVHKRRKKIRFMAIEYKGGQCERCGYSRCFEALEFHHTDPHQKDFNISSKGYTRSWKRVQEELNKCVMLCANCHREVHAELAALSGNIEMTSGLNQGNLKLLRSSFHDRMTRSRVKAVPVNEKRERDTTAIAVKAILS